jgi:uncharacterized membrane protein (Fun14 family)
VVNFLPPDLNTTFVVAVLVPLVLGFIVGVIIRSAIKIGIALVVIVILLIALGIVTPSQVIQPLLSLIKSGPSLTSTVNRLAGYLPYSSLTFVIGLAVGLLKG